VVGILSILGYLILIILCRLILRRIISYSDLTPNLKREDLTVYYIFAPISFVFLLVVYLKYVILKDVNKQSKGIAKIYKWFYFIDKK